eukprot:2971769-Pleurochrysis_carterae.AAC.5
MAYHYQAEIFRYSTPIAARNYACRSKLMVATKGFQLRVIEAFVTVPITFDIKVLLFSRVREAQNAASLDGVARQSRVSQRECNFSNCF